MGTRTEVDSPVLIEWIRNVAPNCDWVTSVCADALLLHEAGSGRNRRMIGKPGEAAIVGECQTITTNTTNTIMGTAMVTKTTRG